LKILINPIAASFAFKEKGSLLAMTLYWRYIHPIDSLNF
jgi:hypothetical protein